MREETIFSLPVTRLRAWTLLSDLPGFEAWHPDYRFSGGVVGLGNKLDMVWLIMGKPARFTVRITKLEKADTICWKMGSFPFWTIEEGYSFFEEHGALKVRHSFECKGLFSVMSAFVRTGVCRRMATQDNYALTVAKRMFRAVPASNRHKRRAAGAKTRDVNDG
jgi:hypothetical protein